MENKDKSKWIILFTVVLLSFMCCVDTSIVNVALPVIAKKLEVSMADIEWVVASYLIMISASILIFGRLGDLRGKVKIFKFGIIVFTVGSLICSVSQNLSVLVAARIIQGIGGAAAMANNQGIITQVFPGCERGKALGFLASATALGVMVGPPLGGLILSSMSWNFIFLINVPIGIINFILAVKYLPKGVKVNTRFDLKGGILLITGVIILFTSLIKGQTIGFENKMIVLGLLFSIIVLGRFMINELKIKAPLLDFNIFKNSLFSLGIISGLISFICLNASSILQPFYLQDALHLTPVGAGFILMVSPVILAVISPVTGYLADKFGAEKLSIMGLLLMSIGLILISTLSENSSIFTIIIFLVVLSLGNGFFQPSNNSLIMSTVSKDKLGIAGSVNALVRNIGSLGGVAFSTTLLYAEMSRKMGYRVVDYIAGRDDVFIYGMRFVYTALASMCFIAAIITVVRMYNGRKSFELSSKV